jgi:flagellar FliJ protein
MARTFPLAGLLGLRRLEENQAAAALSAANTRIGAIHARRGAALRDLGSSPSEVTDADALRLAAFARAASRSMLSDLAALSTLAETESAQAQEDFQSARARTVGLEKLEEKHSAAVMVEDLRIEQIVLDEIASGSRQRLKEGIAG